MYYMVNEVVSYTHRKGDNVLPHRHNHSEIIVYKGGSGAFTLGDEDYSYSGDVLVIVPKNTEHFERTYVETAVKCCVFGSDYFDISEPVVIRDEKFSSQFNRMYGILGDMGEIFITKGDTSDKRLEELLSELLYIVEYVYSAQQNKLDDQLVSMCNTVKKYIKVHYNHTIRFEILAENIGYSYSRFRHIFVETVGMGLKAYQLGVRMNKALKLLATTKKSVIRIAEEVGYKNYICFFNYFKRVMHMTPLQYRNEVSKGKSFYQVNTFNLLSEDSD